MAVNPDDTLWDFINRETAGPLRDGLVQKMKESLSTGQTSAFLSEMAKEEERQDAKFAEGASQSKVGQDELGKALMAFRNASDSTRYSRSYDLRKTIASELEHGRITKKTADTLVKYVENKQKGSLPKLCALTTPQSGLRWIQDRVGGSSLEENEVCIRSELENLLFAGLPVDNHAETNSVAGSTRRVQFGYPRNLSNRCRCEGCWVQLPSGFGDDPRRLRTNQQSYRIFTLGARGAGPNDAAYCFDAIGLYDWVEKDIRKLSNDPLLKLSDLSWLRTRSFGDRVANPVYQATAASMDKVIDKRPNVSQFFSAHDLWRIARWRALSNDVDEFISSNRLSRNDIRDDAHVSRSYLSR